MCTEEMESYLSNIEEFIFDDKKIVSCCWLSKTLRIHTNLSKQLLYTFLQNSPKKEDLTVTYLVIGLSKQDKCCKVSIVKDKDLPAFEEDLDSISSKHIYSIQKSEDLPDLNVLYIAQKDESCESVPKGISAVDFNSNERDYDVMQQSKMKALPTPSTKPNVFKKFDSKSANVVKSPTKKIEPDQSTQVTNSEKVNPEKTNHQVHPMFKNNVTSKKKPNEKVTANTKKAGGIGAFFSKTAKPVEPSKPAPVVDCKVEKESVSGNEKKTSPAKENKATLNICNENGDDQERSKEPAFVSAKTKKAKPSSKKLESKRKKTSAKKVEKDGKKRKRLVVLSDSESNNSEDEKEVEREPTPEPEPTMLPDEEDADNIICGTPEPSRKRKRKLVSKSFTSPDGYLMTEKVYVSCSEEEEEKLPEKKLKENPLQDKPSSNISDTIDKSKTVKSSPQKKVSAKTNKSSPQKVKQTSLMNFFKQK